MLLLLVCARVHSQELSPPLKVTPSDNDRYAASQAQNVKHHAKPAHTLAGQATPRTEISNLHSVPARPDDAGEHARGTRYSADLQYHGGPVVTSMQQHLIYVNLGSSASCNTVATCWGDPHRFLRDLGRSHMIHIVDQYTGSNADDRYTVSDTPVRVSYSANGPVFGNEDILALLHAVVTTGGLPTGYGNEYHVFLVPGQDVCFNNWDGSLSNVCYSPDNPANFVFCAYHGSADFNGIGHVLYSVQPFQNVPGCHARPGTPNGPLVDEANSVLSHEVFETITDPDGSAWWNSLNLSLRWQEIGDECMFLRYDKTGAFLGFDLSDVTLNGRPYAIQPEENNARHGCSTAAGIQNDEERQFPSRDR